MIPKIVACDKLYIVELRLIHKWNIDDSQHQNVLAAALFIISECEEV